MGPTSLLCAFVLACDAGGSPASTKADPAPAEAGPARAHVMAVSATGDAGAYTFSVTVSSPDTGCQQYANWWEVLGADGTLLYRRILEHSHTTEQPFTRSGGPVPAGPTDALVVRAHMHPGGYGGAALRGTVEGGWTAADDLPDGFAAAVEPQDPQPTGCGW